MKAGPPKLRPSEHERAPTVGSPPSTRQETQKPLLLFFYSPTDGRSRLVEAYLAQVLQRRKNHDTFRVRRIDATERADLVERLRVSTLPSLVVIDARRVRARLDRPRSTREISERLKPWLH